MIKYLYIFFLFANIVNAQQLAFPTAMGAGANATTGGRGGTVIHVTNLNDSGAGSFREALQTSGTRIIVFDVSGVINLTSDLVTTHGNFTVAGQTAPEGGITIVGTTSIRVQANNHIWRYVRFRCGYDDSNVDGGWVNTSSDVGTRNYSNVIFDHCSSALAKETAGLGGGMDDDGGQNPTFTSQNNLIVESDRGTLVGDSNDSDPSTVLVYRNAYINSGWRFPKAGGEIDLDVINTYVYNWEFRIIRMDGYDYKLNLINNYYEAGNGTRLTDNPEILFTTFTNNTMTPQIWDEGTTIVPYVYNGGANTYNPTPIGYPADLSKAWDPFFDSTEPINPNWFANSRLPLNGDTPPIWNSNTVKDNILEEAGANKYIDNNGQIQTYRDAIDAGAINIAKGLSNSYIINGTTYSYSGSYKVPESSYQSMALALVNDTISTSRPGNFYDSNPHIPEAYLVSRGITGDANIHNQVQPSGYTLLEEYINQVDEIPGETLSTPSPQPEDISLIGRNYKMYNLLGQLIKEGKFKENTWKLLEEQYSGFYITKIQNIKTIKKIF